MEWEHGLRNIVEHLSRAIRYNLFCSKATKKSFRFYPGYAGRGSIVELLLCGLWTLVTFKSLYIIWDALCWFAAKEVAERTNNIQRTSAYKRFLVFWFNENDVFNRVATIL